MTLQSATLEGDHVATQMLVRQRGIRINHQSSYDDAFFLLAAKKLNQQQSVRIVYSLVLHSDLDVNISDSEGRTALRHVVDHGHHELVKLLDSQSHVKLNDADRYGVMLLA